MPFVCNSKTLFLTYSQISENGQIDFFQNASAHYEFIVSTLGTPICYRLGRERHQDGGIHAHCYLSFEKPVRIRSERRLDFGSSHPNIQSVRTGHKRTWEYAGKDGDIILDIGERPSEPRSSKARDDEIWQEIIRQETETEFYDTCRALAPKYYVLYRANLERYCAVRYHTVGTEYESPAFDANLPDSIQRWLDQAKLGERGGARRQSLILWGPSKTGKTLWARSLGR